MIGWVEGFRLIPSRSFSSFLPLPGFLIALTILASCMLLGFPSYRAYAVRSRDASAQVDARELRVAEERFFVDHGVYTSDCAALCDNSFGLSKAGTQWLSLEIEPSETGRPTYTAKISHPRGTRIYTATPEGISEQPCGPDAAPGCLSGPGKCVPVNAPCSCGSSLPDRPACKF